MKNFLTVLLLAALVSLSFSQSDFKPEIKVGATVFTGWEYNLDNADFMTRVDTNLPDANLPFGYTPAKNQVETNRNTFYLDRAYINVLGTLTPEISGKVTTDFFTITDGAGRTQWTVGIKNAFLSYYPFSWDNGMKLGFDLGVIGNNWKGTNERYWGYRGFAKTFTDFSWTLSASRSGTAINRTTGTFFSSADLGFNFNVLFQKDSPSCRYRL
jgi:hypothetical protein